MTMMAQRGMGSSETQPLSATRTNPAEHERQFLGLLAQLRQGYSQATQRLLVSTKVERQVRQKSSVEQVPQL